MVRAGWARCAACAAYSAAPCRAALVDCPGAHAAKGLPALLKPQCRENGRLRSARLRHQKLPVLERQSPPLSGTTPAHSSGASGPHHSRDSDEARSHCHCHCAPNPAQQRRLEGLQVRDPSLTTATWQLVWAGPAGC